MERLVRGHPCNIMVTYINEPFPGGCGKPHRHLTRAEMESFFAAADQAVRLANPDRVIKAVDGDYDPPGPGLPDNHCYCGWYNGHGVEIWAGCTRASGSRSSPAGCYGCGEFGAEGLDPVERHAPPLPEATGCPPTAEEESLDARSRSSRRRPAASLHVVRHARTRSPTGCGQPGAPGLGHTAHDRSLPPRQPDALASPSISSSTRSRRAG